MHGYRPRTTAPSTLLVLSHVHLDDYRAVAAGLEEARRTSRPFSSRHRIVDTRHRLHQVMLTSDPFHDLDGNVAGMQGLWLDMTAISSTANRDGHSHPGQDADQRQRVRDATRC